MQVIRFRNTLLLALVFMPLLAFQNCGRKSATANAESPDTVQTDSSSNVLIGDLRGLVPQSTPAVAHKYVIPISIDFYSHLSLCDSEDQNGCGVYFLPGFWRQAFLFNVEIATGIVTDRGGNLVLQISAAELKQLRSLLNGSVAASANKFSPASACAVSDGDGSYARLQTDADSIDLNSIGCDSVDLFNPASGQPVGLETFLTNLNQEVAARIGIEVIP